MSTTEDTPDVITVLRHDHQRVEELFKKVQDHARFRNRRKEIGDQVIIELVRHAVAEEHHVYPILRAAAGGQAVVDHALISPISGTRGKTAEGRDLIAAMSSGPGGGA